MSAKDILVKPISRQDADRIVKACHYSGKVVQNSQLHFGVFLNGKCGGAMQFGPSLGKRKIQGLVSGTSWNGFIELNRMAFADWLPRNSESRAIGVALRMIRKAYPHIEWVVSFADGTQCGDGTIYRASGFVLTGIRENETLMIFPNGEIIADISIQAHLSGKGGILPAQLAKKYGVNPKGGSTVKEFLAIGAKYIPGFQLRYIYFLTPTAKSRLTVPILPFSEISRRGAGMYLGKPKRAGSDTTDTAGLQPAEGGSIPTPALHLPTA